MKRVSLFTTLLLTWGSLSFGATVPVKTAKQVGYNHLMQNGGGLKSADDLQLIYTSGQGQQYFYVFGTGNSFVIVAADDAVIPVLGYSTSNAFRADNMPESISGFLADYNNEIDFVIKNNVPATQEIAAAWKNLEENRKTGAKTTAAVSPLLTTTWDQGTFYNAMCPVDVAGMAAGHCVTGCVATAMSQVMRFWRWPNQGVGSSSYSIPAYGILTADFGATTYNWFMMPPNVSSANNAVATLMSHAGISVDMGYSANESGAYTVEMVAGTGNNCAEYALKTYFNYKTSLHGISLPSSSSTTWIATLKTELDNGRPVLVDGSGSAGGHNFIFDGYDASGKFHVNWGWSGSSDGYFTATNLNPAALGIGGGGGNFNSNRHAIIGIEPNGAPTVLAPDVYEPNNTVDSAYTLPLTWTSNTSAKTTVGSNFHITTDQDYYRIILPAGHSYTIKPKLNDYGRSDESSNVYLGDGLWRYSTNNGTTWSSTYNDTMSGAGVINIAGVAGDTVIFRVLPRISGTSGTYLLKMDITRTPAVGIEQVGLPTAKVFPNPATELVTIDLAGTGATASMVTLTDMQGRVVYNADVNTQGQITVPVKSFAAGIYLLNVATDNGTLNREITIGGK